MVRNAVQQLIAGALSRRDFVTTLASLGVGAAAAGQFADALATNSQVPQSIELTGSTGGQITCETLKLWDVQYVFGNTGAYEAGFVDALVDYPDIHYVLGLQEGSVMAMADGYARATGKTAFVNIHSITGTANALGLIVNAWADASPVVISVGFSERSGENRGVFTETTKLESIPELFTKLSFVASHSDNLGESLRRAFRLASVLPSGPVFLGVPADVWSGKVEKTSLIPASRTATQARIAPAAGAIDTAADLLARAQNPLLIAGAELPRWGGLQALAEISDQLGAAVSGDTSSSRSSMGFPSDHPRYLGPLRRAIKSPTPYDVVLIAGASRLSLARGGHPLIPTNARIIETGLREDHLARAYPADLLIYAHPELSLQKLSRAIKSRRLSKSLRAGRNREARALASKRRETLKQSLARVWDSRPLAAERLAAEINTVIDQDAVVVTEGVTSDTAITSYIHFDQAGGGRRHLISSGGSLGWGVGAGIGARLGLPEKQVVVLLGDGSFQFAVQALWTAKRFEVPLIIIIFNNRGYQANRWALARLQDRAVNTGQYIGVSLEDPDIDHVGIARAYGLQGERVVEPGDLKAALQRAVAAEKQGQAYVLDVLIARHGGGSETSWHESHVPAF